MKAKKHVNKTIIFSLILFFIISILSVYSSLDFLAFNQNIFVKQIIFYIVGFFIVFVMVKCDISKILKYSLYKLGFNFHFTNNFLSLLFIT